MSRTLIKLAAAAAFVMTAPVASGHHSTAMFDDENPIELAGTVMEWQFANPHCVIMLEVEGESGAKELWALEGMSPNVIFRQGWRPDTLQPGDRIIATVNPLRSGAASGNYRNLRWADGTAVDPSEGRPD